MAEGQEAETAVRGQGRGGLCVRVPCPYGTPCAEFGLDRVLGLAPVGVAVACLVDHKIVWANAAVSSMLRDVLECDVGELFDESSRPDIEAVIDAAASGRDAMRARVTGRCDDTARRCEVVSSFPQSAPAHQCILYVHPSTSEAEQILTAVLDRSQTYALITDHAGVIRFATPAALRVLGAAELSEAVGVQLWEFRQVGPSIVRQLYSQALANPGDVVSARVDVRIADHTVPFDVFIEHSTGAPIDGMLLWGHPVAQEPGYVQGNAHVAVLSSAMQAIAREVAWAGFAPSAHVGAAVRQLPESDRLNERERQIVLLLAQGLRAPAIAERMFVSHSTVRNYLSTIYRKLGVANLTALLERLFEPSDSTERRKDSESS